MRKRTILTLTIVVLVFSLSALFIGLPSRVAPDDFSGTANANLLYQWTPDIDRLEESKSAWWLPGQRQARHFFYGRSGEQLVWLETVRTRYGSSAAATERFEAFEGAYTAGRVVVNSQMYDAERLGDLPEDTSGLAIKYNDSHVGVRIMVRRGRHLTQTTLLGIYPASQEERQKLMGAHD